MPKEIAAPSPIPVKTEENCIDDELYCATYMNYSEESFSETSKNLVQYLETEYFNTGLGGSTRNFIAKDANLDDVYFAILNANIEGINERSISDHIMLTQVDTDVMIFVMLY